MENELYVVCKINGNKYRHRIEIPNSFSQLPVFRKKIQATRFLSNIYVADDNAFLKYQVIKCKVSFIKS